MNLIEQWKESELFVGDIDLRINIYRNKALTEEQQETGKGNPDSMHPTDTEKDNVIETNTETDIKAQNTNTETQDTNTEIKGSDTETRKDTNLTDTEKKMLELIRQNPSITLSEMATASGLSISGDDSTL